MRIRGPAGDPEGQQQGGELQQERFAHAFMHRQQFAGGCAEVEQIGQSPLATE
jgi:hypothetical protein